MDAWALDRAVPGWTPNREGVVGCGALMHGKYRVAARSRLVQSVTVFRVERVRGRRTIQYWGSIRRRTGTDPQGSGRASPVSSEVRSW
jgi:hypothetical protein